MTIEQAISILNAMGKGYGWDTPILIPDPNDIRVNRADVNIYAWKCTSKKEKKEYGSEYFVTFEI